MKTLPRTQASIGLCLALSACTLRTYVIDRDGAVTADVARDAVDVAAPDVPLVPDGTTDVPGDGPALDVLDEATDATLDVVPDTRIEPDAADESDSASVPDGPLDAPDAAPDVLDDLPPPTDLAVPPDSLDAGSMPDTLVPTDVPDSAPPRDVIDVIDTGPSCASPRTLCGTSCVDTTTDATHCGRCNTPCPGTTNGAALCASSTCTIRCNDGFVLQGSTCTAVPPPRLVWPPTGSVSTSQRPALRWELAPGTDGALVEFCATRTCTTVAQSATATGGTLTLSMPLSAGLWFWRVRGRSGSVTGTAASPSWELTVEPMRASTPASVWGTRLDVNGDGRADVALGADVLRIHLSNGTSVHDVTPATLSGAGVLQSIASGDFNGDGLGDVAVLLEGSPATVRTVLGRTDLSAGAALTATPALTYVVSGTAAPYLAPAGDLDGDGYGDLLGYTQDDALLYWWRGSSTGLRGPRLTLSLASSHPIYDIAGIGDFDADGYSDFAVTYSGGGATLWFGGSEEPIEGPELALPTGYRSDCRVAGVGDVDGDGFPDLAQSCPREGGINPSGAVLVYRGGRRTTARGLDAWSLSQSPDFMRPGDVYGTAVQGVGDFTGDGRDELAVVTTEASEFTDHLVVLANLTPVGGTVLAALTMRGGTDLTATRFTVPRILGVGFVDGDARPEIVVGSPFDMTRTGSVTFVPGTLLDTGLRSFAMPAAGFSFGHLLASAPTRRGRRSLARAVTQSLPIGKGHAL